jgi:hypothetical protein
MIEVQPNEYVWGEPGQVLITRDVYTCLVLALRIRGERGGLMGHFYDHAEAAADIAPLEGCADMIDQAIAAAGNPDRVSGWAAGCAEPGYDRDGKETAALRQGVVDLASVRGIRLLRALWLPNEYAIPRAELDLPRAKFRAPFSHMRNWPD